MTTQAPYEIGTRNGDAYVTGDIDAARRDALKELGWLRVYYVAEGTPHYLAEAGDTTETPARDMGDYWGTGPDRETALRFCIGAVLDPREGM